MTLNPVEGHIRDGAPVVDMDGDRAGPARTIRFHFLRGKAEAGTLDRVWPDDFAFADEDATAGRAALSGADAFEPYTGVVVSVDGERVPVPEGWGLNRLFAVDEADFERIFFQTRHRPPDPETQFFATRQLMDHYHDNESHRCVASVIMGYRAIDLARPEMLEAARTALRLQLSRAPELPVSWRPRLDGAHLTASLHSVLWQIHLFVEDHEALIAELDQMIAFLKVTKEPLSTIVINGCPALHVRAHLMAMQGRNEEALELAYFNAEFYVSGLQRLKKVHKLFKEMLPPHHLVIASLALAELLKKGQGPEPVDVIRISHRIDKKQPSAAVMNANYVRLCQSLKAA